MIYVRMYRPKTKSGLWVYYPDVPANGSQEYAERIADEVRDDLEANYPGWRPTLTTHQMPADLAGDCGRDE